MPAVRLGPGRVPAVQHAVASGDQPSEHEGGGRADRCRDHLHPAALPALAATRPLAIVRALSSRPPGGMADAACLLTARAAPCGRRDALCAVGGGLRAGWRCVLRHVCARGLGYRLRGSCGREPAGPEAHLWPPHAARRRRTRPPRHRRRRCPRPRRLRRPSPPRRRRRRLSA
jgi:hypothetical protein